MIEIKEPLKRTILILGLVAELIIIFVLIPTAVKTDSVDLFWVEVGGSGTGNWSDINHWSTSSGGVGGHAVPTTYNNVHFDSKSFQSGTGIVTLDEQANVKGLDFTGCVNNPTIAGNHDLLCFGDNITIIPGIKVTNTGATYINATSGMVDISISVPLSGALYLGSSSASTANITLYSDIDIGSNKLTWRFGTINTNSHTITCGTSTNINGLQRSYYYFGSSVINCTNWTLSYSNKLISDFGKSTIKVTGTGNFNGGGQHYYNVELNGTSHIISNGFVSPGTIRNLFIHGKAIPSTKIKLSDDLLITNNFISIGDSSDNRIVVESNSDATMRHIASGNITISCTNFSSDILNTEALQYQTNISGRDATQGFAYDGTNYYLISTNKINKFDSDWNLLASRDKAATSDCRENHLGDGKVYNGKLYVAVNDYPGTPTTYKAHIGVWNTSDLSFVGSYDISAQQIDASALCIDSSAGIIYVARFDGDGPLLYKYKLNDFSYNGTLSLSSPITQVQGITLKNHYFYFSSQKMYSILKVSETGVYQGLIGFGCNEMEGLDWVENTLYLLLASPTNSIYVYIEPT
ncbi:MAG: hypothetical protein ABR954_08370 [Dehalococcoidales bacterium]